MAKEKKPVFEDIENKTQKIFKDHVKHIEDLKSEKEVNKNYIANINDKLNDPETDIETFKELSTELSFYNKRQEYINEQINSAHEKPLINSEEYNELINSIMSEYEAEYKKTESELLKMTEDIESKLKDLLIVLGHANDLLKFTQKDLFKYNDMPINATGVRCIVNAREKNIGLTYRANELRKAIDIFNYPDKVRNTTKVWGNTGESKGINTYS